MTPEEAIEILVVRNGDQWWWSVGAFCCEACFRSQGHGDQHEDWCQHAALDALIAHFNEAEESRQIWSEVATDVCKATGVDALVHVPDRFAELQAEKDEWMRSALKNDEMVQAAWAENTRLRAALARDLTAWDEYIRRFVVDPTTVTPDPFHFCRQALAHTDTQETALSRETE